MKNVLLVVKSLTKITATLISSCKSTVIEVIIKACQSTTL